MIMTGAIVSATHLRPLRLEELPASGDIICLTALSAVSLLAFSSALPWNCFAEFRSIDCIGADNVSQVTTSDAPSSFAAALYTARRFLSSRGGCQTAGSSEFTVER